MLAVSGYDVVMAIHIMAVVIAFGWTFTLPVVYAIAARQDPRSLPTLHRVEFAIFRYVANPALVIVLAAGIFLASDGHHWSEFFVQWGIAAVVIVGAPLDTQSSKRAHPHDRDYGRGTARIHQEGIGRELRHAQKHIAHADVPTAQNVLNERLCYRPS